MWSKGMGTFLSIVNSWISVMIVSITCLACFQTEIFFHTMVFDLPMGNGRWQQFQRVNLDGGWCKKVTGVALTRQRPPKGHQSKFKQFDVRHYRHYCRARPHLCCFDFLPSNLLKKNVRSLREEKKIKRADNKRSRNLIKILCLRKNGKNNNTCNVCLPAKIQNVRNLVAQLRFVVGDALLVVTVI